MADLRLLEDGTSHRLLEDSSGFRLLEDHALVAGGQIAFPGGYGYGSGGYAGGGAGSGGGGLAGGGQGGAGSGGGAGTGTTTTVSLPFKPGLILFIMTNQTLGGWRTFAADGTFHWTCTGMASWGAADKSSIFNCAHGTHYKATGELGTYGSGQYEGRCIWIRDNLDAPYPDGVSASAHVSAIHDNGFDLYWDVVAGSGYPIYYVAARDQKSWGDWSTNAVLTIDGLTGGSQDNRPQGGFSFYNGYNVFGSGGLTFNYLASSVSQWARPDMGDNFDPMTGKNAYVDNMFEQAYTINGSPPGDADADAFSNLPNFFHGIAQSPWIAGTILQRFSSLVVSNGQVVVDWNTGSPMGFTWATGAPNSCDARFLAPAVSGTATHELAYDFVNESRLKAQMGFCYSNPRHDGASGVSIGHSVGIWARQVEDDPTQDFHASIAVGRDVATGQTVGYFGTDFSWLGEFSVANPGTVAAGRLEYQQPGEIVTQTDQSESAGRSFMLWLNGVPVGGWIPQIYRLVMPT